jgi:hypothetical protein
MRHHKKSCRRGPFRNHDPSLFVVSRPKGQKLRQTEAHDESGKAIWPSCHALQPLRRVAPMLKTAAAVSEEKHFMLSSLRPGPA